MNVSFLSFDFIVSVGIPSFLVEPQCVCFEWVETIGLWNPYAWCWFLIQLVGGDGWLSGFPGLANAGNNTERGGELVLSSQIFLFQIQMIYATSIN